MEMKEKQVGKLFFYTDNNPDFNLQGIIFREPLQKRLNDLDPSKEIIEFRAFRDGKVYWMGISEVVFGRFVVENK